MPLRGLCPARPSLGFWNFSPHTRSFLHLYRFVDPKVEVQYRQRLAVIWRAVLRMYCAVTFLLAAEELFQKVDETDRPLFWTLLAIALSSLGLFALSVWWRAFPQYALPIHTLYVCAVSGAYTYQVRLDAAGQKDAVLRKIFAADGAELTTLLEHSILSRAQDQVAILVGIQSVRDGLLYSCIHWVSLALAGFNGWTVLAYVGIVISTVTGYSLNPTMETKIVSAFYVAVCTLGFGCVSVVMERVRRSDFLAHVQLARELQATQLADSVLNHMLKNTLADVAANLEIYLAGELGPEVLEDAVVCLRRGIRSCRERMVYLKMVAGEYKPVMNTVNLKEFGQQLVAGRSVASQLLGATVLMDSTLMQLVLENALSNAFKHGHPDHPDVALLIQKAEPPQPTVDFADRQFVSFIVKNTADPSSPPLTEETVEALFRGEARLQPTAVVPTLSDGIGMTHCVLAARLGGMALSLQQQGDVVTFTATVEVGRAEEPFSRSAEDGLRSIADRFPPGLRILCLDDSAAARRLMEFHLRKGCPLADIRTYGATEDEVDGFVRDALEGADIAIVDQNLQFSRTHYGTDLCRQLAGHGFQ
eukprot:EG_transcript_7473